MTTTIIQFNTNDPAGRAIEHLLEKSALADVSEHLRVEEHAGGGRTVIVDPQFSAYCSVGEASLLLVAESLNSSQKVCLSWILASLDGRSKRAVAEAILIAAGFSGHTMLAVPA